MALSKKIIETCIEFHHQEMFRLTVQIRRLEEEAQTTICEVWPIIEEIEHKRELMNYNYSMIEYYNDMLTKSEPEQDIVERMSHVNLNL